MAHIWNLWSGSTGSGEQQYLSKFYHSVAEADRDLLQMPIGGCVQAKSASQRQWSKWIGAAESERSKVHGGILFNKWYLLDTQDTNPENTVDLSWPAAIPDTLQGLNGYRLELMPHQRLVPAAASPNAQRKSSWVQPQPSWRVPASAVSTSGGATAIFWRRRVQAEPSPGVEPAA